MLWLALQVGPGQLPESRGPLPSGLRTERSPADCGPSDIQNCMMMSVRCPAAKAVVTCDCGQGKLTQELNVEAA